MPTILNRKVIAVGEAMLELAPVGDGLYRKGFAGDTFNTTWHMAQLLGQAGNVGYATCVGQDKLSGDFVQELQADGLNVDGVFRDPARSMGLYLIELDGVERSFHYWRSVSAAKGLADDPARLAQALTGAGLIHLSGITLAILPPSARHILFEVIANARAQGAVVSFDPNIRPRLWSGPAETRDAISTMLALTDIAVPSFDDEAALWGDKSPRATIARYVAAGVQEVVVKDGAEAVTFRTATAEGLVQTLPVPGICDTTGAGDAFNAGYLGARLCGKAAQQAIPVGQALSAAVICTYGARASKKAVMALAPLIAGSAETHTST